MRDLCVCGHAAVDHHFQGVRVGRVVTYPCGICDCSDLEPDPATFEDEDEDE